MASWEAVAKELDPTSVVPQLTAADPRIIASEQADTAHASWQLFDRVFNSASVSYVPKVTYPTVYYMGFNFGVATKISSVTWWYSFEWSSIPQTFNIEGSDDLTNWTIIDTFSYDSWIPMIKYKFYITPTIYKAFRINVTQLRNLGSAYSYIGEAEFCCASGQQGVDKNLNMPVMII